MNTETDNIGTQNINSEWVQKAPPDLFLPNYINPNANHWFG